MEVLKNLPMEFVKPFVLSFDMLHRGGAGFLLDVRYPRNVKKYVRFVFTIPCILVTYVSLSPAFLDVFGEKLDLSLLANLVALYGTVIQGFFKIVVVCKKKREIKSVTTRLGTIWRMTDLNGEQIKKKNGMLKMLRYFQSVFYWVNMAGLWQYIVAPLVETLFCAFMSKEECEWLFPFPCTFPFNPTRNWLIYILTYVFEAYGIYTAICLYLSPEFLVITLCAHLSTEFMLLQEDLRNIDLGKTNASTSNTEETVCEEYSNVISLNGFVRRHQKLVKLAQELDAIFNKMIFVNLLFPTITICFFGFTARLAEGPLQIVGGYVTVIALILPIFNLCYYSQVLSEASVGLADAAYELLWYKNNKDIQRKICFIIQRCQKACSMTSLGYSPITLKTFTKVLSTTWSYFSLATTIYEDE